MKVERYKSGVRIYLGPTEARGIKLGLARVCEFYNFPVCHRLYELMKYVCYQPRVRPEDEGKHIKKLLEEK